MTPSTRAMPRLHDAEPPVRVKLAAGWTSFMFLYVYVDILGFYLPGVVEDILAGVVWEFQISQPWATGALALMAIPIMMVVLSMALPARANRVTNLVVAAAYLPVSVGNAVGETWTVFFGLAVVLEVAVLVGILRWAWYWPHERDARTPHAPLEVRSRRHGRPGRGPAAATGQVCR